MQRQQQGFFAFASHGCESDENERLEPYQDELLARVKQLRAVLDAAKASKVTADKLELIAMASRSAESVGRLLGALLAEYQPDDEADAAFEDEPEPAEV